MKPVPITSSIRVKRALPLLGALLLFTFFLLSCRDLSDDDDSAPTAPTAPSAPTDPIVPDPTDPIVPIDPIDPTAPKFSIDVFAGDGTADYKDGQGTAAQFFNPSGIAVASDGTVYVTDKNNHRIRKITSGGLVSTLAGDGTADYKDGKDRAAWFNGPEGIAVASDGTVYVADIFSRRIRKIEVASDGTGTVSTFAGGEFTNPAGVAVASDGMIYVSDIGKNSISKITPEGKVTTFAGGGTAAEFSSPFGIAVASDGTVYVADRGNNRIRKITSAGEVTTIVKDLNRPSKIALSSDGSTAYVTNFDSNQILKLTNPSRAGSTPLEIMPLSPKLKITVGNTMTLTATSNIPGAGTPTWSVTPNDGSIATVTPAGVLTGVAPGTATLTVTINGLSKTVGVNVTAS